MAHARRSVEDRNDNRERDSLTRPRLRHGRVGLLPAEEVGTEPSTREYLDRVRRCEQEGCLCKRSPSVAAARATTWTATHGQVPRVTRLEDRWTRGRYSITRTSAPPVPCRAACAQEAPGEFVSGVQGAVLRPHPELASRPNRVEQGPHRPPDFGFRFSISRPEVPQGAGAVPRLNADPGVEDIAAQINVMAKTRPFGRWSATSL